MKLETELFGIAPLSLSLFSVHPTLLVRQGAALRPVGFLIFVQRASIQKIWIVPLVINPVHLPPRLMIYQVVVQTMVHRMFLLSFLWKKRSLILLCLLKTIHPFQIHFPYLPITERMLSTALSRGPWHSKQRGHSLLLLLGQCLSLKDIHHHKTIIVFIGLS